MTLDENGVLCDLYGEPVVTQGMLELEREQHCVLCVHYYIPESFCELRSIGMNPHAWCEHFAWN